MQVFSIRAFRFYLLYVGTVHLTDNQLTDVRFPDKSFARQLFARQQITLQINACSLYKIKIKF